eukprot:gene16019-biopygen12711
MRSVVSFRSMFSLARALGIPEEPPEDVLDAKLTIQCPCPNSDQADILLGAEDLDLPLVGSRRPLCTARLGVGQRFDGGDPPGLKRLRPSGRLRPRHLRRKGQAAAQTQAPLRR